MCEPASRLSDLFLLKCRFLDLKFCLTSGQTEDGPTASRTNGHTLLMVIFVFVSSFHELHVRSSVSFLSLTLLPFHLFIAFHFNTRALSLNLIVALFIWTVVWNEFCDSLTDCSSLYFVVIRRSLVSKAPMFYTDTMVRLQMSVCVCVLSVIVFILILWNILLSLYFFANSILFLCYALFGKRFFNSALLRFVLI